MQDDYSWNGANTDSSSYQSHRSEGMGKWVLAALIFALVSHVFVIWGLSRIDVIFPTSVDEQELQTEVVRVYRVETDDSRPELAKPIVEAIQDPIEVVPPADELDMLEMITDIDIDISPDIDSIQVPMSAPAMEGVLDSEALETMKAPVFEPDMTQMGFTEDLFARANDGQVIVDAGARMAEEFDPDEYTDSLKAGAGGAAEDGLFKEFTSLDAMAKMDGNSLLASKALIGSDLLFDFNSATLRQSARLSLMKVALLIDKNPNLVCWVDGHTDLIGSAEPNLILSEKRATAVKTWLVKTLDLDEKQVAIRGFGKTNPLVKSGTAEEQAANRRVEIKMRKGYPTKVSPTKPSEKPAPKFVEKPVIKPSEPAPSVAIPVPENKPILVKPMVPPPAVPRAEIVEELPEFVPEEISENIPQLVLPAVPIPDSAPPRAILEIEDEEVQPIEKIQRNRAIIIEE